MRWALIRGRGEPLAAIHADIDAEGEPGLDAGVHKAEDRMNLVVVQVEALALAVGNLQLLGVTVVNDLEGGTGIDTAQHANEAALDAIPGGNLPCDVLFAQMAGVEVANLASQLLGLT